MPELPEVEVLVHHLRPLIVGRRIRSVDVRREKTVRPHSAQHLERTLVGTRFTGLARRAKYLVFRLRARDRTDLEVLGHLGMTGRMYLLATGTHPPRHAAVVLGLGRHKLVFEDPRYFGRLTLDTNPLDRLGPEPLEGGFHWRWLAERFRGSTQALKVKMMDQSVAAGVGNIYASEALFRARLSPVRPVNRLGPEELKRLARSIRSVLREAIRRGSTVPLDWSGRAKRDRLFYYGRSPQAPDDYRERLKVYGREGEPCPRCRAALRRIDQANRGTFYCPQCQPG